MKSEDFLEIEKRYHVYGIGNALVDMVYEVSPELLERLKIHKGIMTLIDLPRKEELLEELKNLPCKMASGGSAANTVLALGQFGGKGFYSCKVAKDVAGDFYLQDLQQGGVETHREFQCDHATEGINSVGDVTGKCLVMVTPDADRTMNTYLGITSTFGVEQLVPEKISAAEYLYIEGYLVASPHGREAAQVAKNLARKSGVKVALTFSDLSMIEYFLPEINQILGDDGVDLLFCNESEALAFAKTKDLEVAFEKLKKVGKAFVITLGPRGAILYDGQTRENILAHPVEAVDTNGAGDMFAGAFLYGITHQLSFSQAGRLAAVAAGKVVSNFGPRLELSETQKIGSEFFLKQKIR